MKNPMTSRQADEFVGRVRLRLATRSDISSQTYQKNRGDKGAGYDSLINQFLASLFPRLAPHIVVAKLPENEKVLANLDRKFTWHAQDTFDNRVGLVRAHLGRTYGKDVTVEVIRYAGSATEVPLVLTRNPLEALAYGGKGVNPADYCAISRPHLDANKDLKQSDWMKGKLKGNDVRLEESAIKSWGKLPLQPHGKDVVTLWELPVNPGTLFHEEESDELWSLAPRQAVPLVAAAQRHPAELISWSVLLAGEPHMKDQIRSGTANFVDLIGAQVRDDADVWTYVPFCYGDGGGLWLVGYWGGYADPVFADCTFLSGVA